MLPYHLSYIYDEKKNHSLNEASGIQIRKHQEEMENVLVPEIPFFCLDLFFLFISKELFCIKKNLNSEGMKKEKNEILVISNVHF